MTSKFILSVEVVHKGIIPFFYAQNDIKTAVR